jgi:hypothetical protein
VGTGETLHSLVAEYPKTTKRRRVVPFSEKLLDIQNALKNIGGAKNWRRAYDRLIDLYLHSEEFLKLHYDRISAEELFTNIMSRELLLFLDTGFKPPVEIDDSYDVYEDVIAKCVKYKLPYWKKYVYHQIKVKRNLEVYSMYDKDGNIKTEVEAIEGENMEEKVLESIMQRDLETANNTFLEKCSREEAIILTSLLKNLTVNHVKNKLNQMLKVEWSTDKVNHQKNVIEWRLSIFYYLRKIISEQQLMKILKKHANITKYFLGDEVKSLPDEEILMVVSIGKTKIHKRDRTDEWDDKLKRKVDVFFPDSKVVEGKGYRYKSKIDFNGKKHDGFVTYINYGGHAYCFVQRQTKNIMKDEQVA